MAIDPKTLNELFLDTPKGICYAEKQILKALPKMAKAAQSPQLKQAFETLAEELKTDQALSQLSESKVNRQAQPKAA